MSLCALTIPLAPRCHLCNLRVGVVFGFILSTTKDDAHHSFGLCNSRIPRRIAPREIRHPCTTLATWREKRDQSLALGKPRSMFQYWLFTVRVPRGACFPEKIS
ncbi:unnamed protein product [Pseudo-nitzschia multistriata]|uniref:Uncharacterized protein n=1 Tax=Pseudo-nitzschia multistriata TaxID=183589 RepID=A0A448ZBD1_9STRA|nr:unnamed protein product [Pseudo-nitzschia multistriata]